MISTDMKLFVSAEWHAAERDSVADRIREDLLVLAFREPAWVLEGSNPYHPRSLGYEAKVARLREVLEIVLKADREFLQNNRKNFWDWIVV